MVFIIKFNNLNLLTLGTHVTSLSFLIQGNNILCSNGERQYHFRKLNTHDTGLN